LKNRPRRRSVRPASASLGPQIRRVRRTVLIRREHPNVVNIRLLRQIVCAILDRVFPETDGEVSVALLDADQISSINKAFLNHDGPTDVITFDYTDGKLCGEILICIDEAICQARDFGTTWQSELVRYIIHGVLHLKGYQDLVAVARRKMKREENRLLHQLARTFEFGKLRIEGR